MEKKKRKDAEKIKLNKGVAEKKRETDKDMSKEIDKTQRLGAKPKDISTQARGEKADMGIEIEKNQRLQGKPKEKELLEPIEKHQGFRELLKIYGQSAIEKEDSSEFQNREDEKNKEYIKEHRQGEKQKGADKEGLRSEINQDSSDKLKKGKEFEAIKGRKVEGDKFKDADKVKEVGKGNTLEETPKVTLYPDSTDVKHKIDAPKNKKEKTRKIKI